MDTAVHILSSNREQLLHSLYEAAELEHNLMCTYLYAAFSLRCGGEGLSEPQARTVEGWRRTILGVAIEEMAHLAAIWNLSIAIGGSPRFGRMNFPLDPGGLPAGIVVKLAPFNVNTLQHFIFLERPFDSSEPDGEGFSPERRFERGNPNAHLTPMAIDYDTVGAFYLALEQAFVELAQRIGEEALFCGNPALQLAGASVGLGEIKPVRCLKTARAALESIVAQGEGSPAEVEQSHYQKFRAVREEFAALRAADPGFEPAFPAATNPVLRRPPRPEGRVWIEEPEASATVDLGNACYQLMLRLLAYSYAVPAGDASRATALELGIGLMRALGPLGEHAARLPAGASHPECHAGLSFTSLRDAAALPSGRAAERFFVERLTQFAAAGEALARAASSERPRRAATELAGLLRRAQSRWPYAAAASATAPTDAKPALVPALPARETPAASDEIEVVAGRDIEIEFRARRCIHARFCVTWAAKVFLANVKGPWIRPDDMPVERLVEVAHACPSGAIHYSRRDGQPNEGAPPVNLAAIREGGPYAFRAPLRIAGTEGGFRATLCRCGASRNKPFCDGSHHEVGFNASGEPPSGTTEALAARDGMLEIEPLTDGPLSVNGNLEITSGTGRVVARITSGRLCRCGGSRSKPFCDGTHAKIGFRSS